MLILACTFSGEAGMEDANELVLELRERYKLPAYVHRMTKDLQTEMSPNSSKRPGRSSKWKYLTGDKVDEIGVLVGHFTGVDDPGAQKTLEKIKYSVPLCLTPKKGEKSTLSFAGFREFNRQILLAAGKGDKKKGPMCHAFLVPNPLIDKEDLKESLDPFVVKLNEGIEHSLLSCQGKYTVKIAHFSGKVIMDQTEIHQIQTGQKKCKAGGLEKAAEKAAKLADVLQKQGYEAYVFHDRYASFVTIGSFESIGTGQQGGRINLHPRVHQIMEKFKGKPAGPGGPVGPQVIAGIPLSVQPMPVKVPKKSIAAVFAEKKPRGLW